MTILSNALENYTIVHSAVLYLLISSENIIIESSAFAQNRFEMPLVGLSVERVIETFGSSLDYSELATNSELSQRFSVSQFNGTPETFLLTFYPAENGQIIILGMRDDSEQDFLQNNLLQINQELNLVTRDLHKKSAQLQALNELKNEFIGVAAHDLRNPAGIIKVCSQFLLKEAALLDQKPHELLSAINRSSTFMLNLLNELLDLSKIESGKVSLSCQETDYLELIEQSIAMNQIIASQKRISIQLQAPKVIDSVFIDPMKIEQVLNNFLSNAINYSSEGSVITVSFELKDQRLRTTVRDYGQGISKADQAEVFKAFKVALPQSDSTAKSTGLGLYIVKKIVLSHGGKIGLDSEIGQGSTFWFELPCLEQHPETQINEVERNV